jgi:hypothetical protein
MINSSLSTTQGPCDQKEILFIIRLIAEQIFQKFFHRGKDNAGGFIDQSLNNNR